MASNDVLFDVLTRFAGTISDHFDVADVLYGLTDHTVQVLDASGVGVSLDDDNDSSSSYRPIARWLPSWNACSRNRGKARVTSPSHSAQR